MGGRRWLATGTATRLTGQVGRVLFPHFCLRCGVEGKLLCDNCEMKYASQRGVLFSLNKSVRCFSAGRYADPILRTLLHLYKYERVSEAGEILVRLSVACAGRQAATVLAGMDQPTVVPLPMNPINQALRGFNQIEAFAKALAVDFELDLEKNIVNRRFAWRPQAKMTNFKRRRQNVKNSFFIQSGQKIPREILLVDDVLTTGATALSCSGVLKQAGAQQILLLTMLKSTK